MEDDLSRYVDEMASFIKKQNVPGILTYVPTD
jgi:hypothetical protein